EFYGFNTSLNNKMIGLLTGSTMIALALSTLAAHLKLIKPTPALVLALIVSIVPLLTLLASNRWMAQLGGFPIIGSGQGIIKYFAVIPLYLFLFYKNKLTDKQHVFLNFIPVAMVLLWIGGMKFYEFEAKAIVSLVETSPFMSWLYTVFSVQGASNVIGGFDVLFAVLLGIGILLNNKKLIIVSGLACLSVFLMTQTFLITANGALSSSTLLERLGQFVIKDLWYVGNLVVIATLMLFKPTK
ncbi:YkgB family protein, partial [Pseudoalteromonas marina]|nr:YkgB family protein [Pseudoalteromonas marina]